MAFPALLPGGLVEQGLEFAVFVHFGDDIAAADEFG